MPNHSPTKIAEIQRVFAETGSQRETARRCKVDRATVVRHTIPKEPQQANMAQQTVSVEAQLIEDRSPQVGKLALFLFDKRTKEEIAAQFGLRPGATLDLLDDLAKANPNLRNEDSLYWIAPDEEKPVSNQLAADRARLRTEAEAKLLKQKYDAALKELEQSEARFDALSGVRATVEPLKIEANPNLDGGEAAAIWLASDWHVGERVDPKTINYLNEYNPDIAESRARRFFQNGLHLVRKERQNVQIDTLILWLGGDLITGYIHDELEESNYLSPTEEAQFAKRLIIGGLKMLKADGEFKRIQIVCSHGNHGRTTAKRRVSTAYKNSYEWMLYGDLAALFEGDEVIQFQLTNGYFNYLECFGRMLRFHHGDNISYQGGVGGVTIPLNKFIARSNQQQWADMDSIGHYHQRTPYANWCRFQINSSLIGFNAYAQAIGASPEPPTQNFQLLDAKRGFTIAAPIQVGE